MSQEARVARLELQLAAASAESERQDAGSIWTAIREADTPAAWANVLSTWRVPRAVAWVLTRGSRDRNYAGEELSLEDRAYARRQADAWIRILWGADGMPTDLNGSDLLSDIKLRLASLLVGDPSKDSSQSM